MTFLQNLIPPIIGGLLGVTVVTYLNRQRGRPVKLEPVPEAVAAIRALEDRMTEEQYRVRVAVGSKRKIDDIKAIRKACRLGLHDAKYIVDHLPQVVGAALEPDEAEAMKEQLESSGMTVQVS